MVELFGGVSGHRGFWSFALECPSRSLENYSRRVLKEISRKPPKEGSYCAKELRWSYQMLTFKLVKKVQLPNCISIHVYVCLKKISLHLFPDNIKGK